MFTPEDLGSGDRDWGGVRPPGRQGQAPRIADSGCFDRARCTHGSFLIRRQRGHAGVVLPLVVSDSANR